MANEPSIARNPRRSSKELRAKYEWYLRPPFHSEFDKSNWWKEKSPLEPDKVQDCVAGLYELARRHPFIGAIRTKHRSAAWYGAELETSYGRCVDRFDAIKDLSKFAPSVSFLCLYGLKTWQGLGATQKWLWRRGLPNIKGVDGRGAHVCQNLIIESTIDAVQMTEKDEAIRKADLAPCTAWKRRETLKKHLSALKPADIAAFQRKFSNEIESSIAIKAIQAFRRGDLLFSIAPDVGVKDAATLLAETYRLSASPHSRQRANPDSWVSLISAFELNFNIQNTNFKRNAAAFTHYRRTIDTIDFR